MLIMSSLFVIFLFVVCITLTADGSRRARLIIPPIATWPYCLWTLRICPSLLGFRLRFFIATDPVKSRLRCYPLLLYSDDVPGTIEVLVTVKLKSAYDIMCSKNRT